MATQNHLRSFGIIALLNRFGWITFTLIAMGIAIFADAQFKIRIAIDAKRFGIGMRWMILSLAFLTAIAGVLVVFLPWQSPNVLTVLLGISLLEEGALNICMAVSMVRIVKHQCSDVIDADYIGVIDIETENTSK